MRQPNQQLLAEALAAACAPRAPVKPIHRDLGVTASPQAFVDHLNARLAAQGVVGERVEYMVERIDGVVIPAGHGFSYGGAAPAMRYAAE